MLKYDARVKLFPKPSFIIKDRLLLTSHTTVCQNQPL